MGHKLLLADDSITIQKVVGIIFANEDYELTVVDNGDAALEKARKVVPDIVLVDALMPGKTGYEVCSEIRRDPVLSKIPLLLLVGAFEPFDEDKAKGSGADDFISKPFESQQLMDKVKHLIDTGKERASEAASPAEPLPIETNPFEDRPASSVPQQPEPPVFTETTGASLVSLGLVEADPDDDLWGSGQLSAGTLEEPVHFGEIVEGDLQSDVAETVEELEPFAFSEEEFPLLEGEAFPERQEFSLPAEHGSVVEEEPLVFDEGPQDDFGALNETDDTVIDPAWLGAGVQEEIPAVATSDSEEKGSANIAEAELRAAISQVSRETIERIVWEVVPDLAEVIIREEIRKIKEGYR